MYLRTRSTVFTRRLNACLEDVREQKGVIEAICREAYRPTERARLASGKPRVSGVSPGSFSRNVSQVAYVGPPRSGCLTMSVGCCGTCRTCDENSDQGDDEEPAEQTAPEVGSDGCDEDREPSIQGTGAGAVEGISADQLTIPMVGWAGANQQEDRNEDRNGWGGTMRPDSGWGVGAPPAVWAGAPPLRWGVAAPPCPPGGWAKALRPAESGGCTGWPPPPHIPMDSSDPNATMIGVECNCHYDRRRGGLLHHSSTSVSRISQRGRGERYVMRGVISSPTAAGGKPASTHILSV